MSKAAQLAGKIRKLHRRDCEVKGQKKGDPSEEKEVQTTCCWQKHGLCLHGVLSLESENLLLTNSENFVLLSIQQIF